MAIYLYISGIQLSCACMGNQRGSTFLDHPSRNHFPSMSRSMTACMFMWGQMSAGKTEHKMASFDCNVA